MADLNSMEFKSGQDHSKDPNMLALGVIKRRLTRQERLAAKEREEAIKAGTLKPELDADGQTINPHVPRFIADAPWYMSDERDGKASLRHQRYLTRYHILLLSYLDMEKLERTNLEWILPTGMPEVRELVPQQQNSGKVPVRIV